MLGVPVQLWVCPEPALIQWLKVKGKKKKKTRGKRARPILSRIKCCTRKLYSSPSVILTVPSTCKFQLIIIYFFFFFYLVFLCLYVCMCWKKNSLQFHSITCFVSLMQNELLTLYISSYFMYFSFFHFMYLVNTSNFPINANWKFLPFNWKLLI